MKVQFISAQALKENSVVQLNTDEKILNLSIREFQDAELEPLLGRTEYERLSQAIVDSQTDEIPLTDEDAEILTYIRPVMIYGSLMYSILPLGTKWTNKGLKEVDDANSQRGDEQGARAKYAHLLEMYKRKLLGFIEERDKNNVSRACSPEHDTTFQFTGICLPDSSFDYEAMYQNEYYKIGGYIVIK